MTESALTLLQHTFGYEHFRGQQAHIIETVASGKDALVLMPTGGGKSLCYQIPALLRDGVAVVISPLIALMQDQVSALEQLGISAAFLNSSLDSNTAWDIEQRLTQGQIKLLYIAPERLSQVRMQNLLQQLPLALFAIDEAHCVSQWGHDFRSDYLQLDILHRLFPNVPRIALTATADQRTRNEIVARLQLEGAAQFIDGFDRPNIQYRIEPKQDARSQLLRFLHNEHPNDAGIVYCLSRRKVDETAAWLAQQGFTALPYHAGLPAQQRQSHQARFLREESIIIVATIAFGMGIDKPDVRFVAHLDLPKSIEAYYQETGRAGRDGLNATAWMVYGVQDVIKLKQMLAQSPGSEEHKRFEHHKLDAMLGLCEITSCRRQALLAYFGEDQHPPCGNCDSCLNPVETFDATTVAQKALSCCYRSGQRFGVNHLMDILLGKETPKVKQFNHQSLSTFGIGKDLDPAQWRSVFRQLASRGYLQVDMDAFGGLKLTDKCRPLLKGQETIQLRKELAQKAEKTGKASKSKARQAAGGLAAADQILWETLRTLRKRLADEQGVPPFVIFHDATLMEMVARQPQSLAAMETISGIGASKLERYGEAFLAEIQQHALTPPEPPTEGIGDTYTKTLALAKAGLDATAIAEQRNMSKSTIINHIAHFIEAGELPLQQMVALPQAQIDTIIDAIFSHDDEPFRFKPVYEALGGAYDYDILKCVRAAVLCESNSPE